MLGVAISTVAGRLRSTGRSGVACQTSVPASQTSTAWSSSVPVNDAGLQRGRVVVEVDQRGAEEADQRLDGALDQFLAGLGQHLDRDVGRHPVVLDEVTDE